MNDITFGRMPGEGRPVPLRQEPARGEGGEQGGMPLVPRLLRSAKRRKWLLVGALAVAAILGFVVTMLMTPQYTARATVEIQRENNRITNVRGVEPETSAYDLEFYQTQYGLLRAETL